MGKMDMSIFEPLVQALETVKEMSDRMCDCGHPLLNHRVGKLKYLDGSPTLFCYTPEDYCLCPDFREVMA